MPSGLKVYGPEHIFQSPTGTLSYYWWPNFATPDRNVNYDISRYPDRWENFVQFTQGQIMELLGGDYGKIDILWLDGGQVQKMTKDEIYRYIDIHPGLQVIPGSRVRISGWMSLLQKHRKAQPGIDCC